MSHTFSAYQCAVSTGIDRNGRRLCIQARRSLNNLRMPTAFYGPKSVYTHFDHFVLTMTTDRAVSHAEPTIACHHLERASLTPLSVGPIEVFL
jgi:hypothetical protein